MTTNNELIRLAEAYARVSVLAAETNGEAVHDAKQSLVDALEAQVKHIEALKADAERYRWWVGAVTENSASALDRVDDAFKHLSKEKVITVKKFNEAIDAALAAQKGGA